MEPYPFPPGLEAIVRNQVEGEEHGVAEGRPDYRALSRRVFDPDSRQDIEAFRALVWDFYASEPRGFPWRETHDPWAILVSEFMLQQTQTLRVLPKYLAFMAAFPGPGNLAGSTVRELLALWSGLGYNRRALSLKASAEAILARGPRGFPDTEEELLGLPGVGPYTARAVLAFAFERPVVLMETNIRSVYLHHFFAEEEGVRDQSLLKAAEAALPPDRPRDWHYALMDYGVFIKKAYGNPNKRSAHYQRQSPFADSKRRIRGAVLRELGPGSLHADELAARIPFSRERVDEAVAELLAEGFLCRDGGTLGLSE